VNDLIMIRRERDVLRQGLEDALGVSFTVGCLRMRAKKENDDELIQWGEELRNQLVEIRETLSPGTAAAMAKLRESL
jgi:hypothetical protein